MRHGTNVSSGCEFTGEDGLEGVSVLKDGRAIRWGVCRSDERYTTKEAVI
jgi:hypothetical protein